MSDLNKLLENYFTPQSQGPEKYTVYDIIELVSEIMDRAPGSALVEAKGSPVETETDEKQLTVTMPVIRISEKMWGKEGSQDREIIQNLLGRLVKHGTTLTEKIKLINNFLEDPPQTDDQPHVAYWVWAKGLRGPCEEVKQRCGEREQHQRARCPGGGELLRPGFGSE